MSRNSAERSRYKKYDYKTHHTSLTQRTESSHPLEISHRTSAFKMSKDTPQKSIPTSCFDDIRLPLGEIFENGAKVTRALVDPRKDRFSLRTRNEELEQQVARQGKEMEQLKSALSNLQMLLGVQREGQQLKEINISLQARCEAQDREMAGLKKDIQALKNALQQGSLEIYQNGQLEESQISRRAEIAKHYQEVMSSIPQMSSICNECFQLKKQLQSQSARVSELQAELMHRDKCIEYLRSQLQIYQRTVPSSACKLESRSSKKGRGLQVKSKPDESFSFAELNYY